VTAVNLPSTSVGQIGYTSSRGGFGIQSQSGELTDAERDQLVRGADPERTDFGEQLPRFAAPEEVARFNRNLVCAELAPGMSAAWHSAPAGADESGRTGNVFVHALIDRDPGADSRRVIDSWRSPEWVTPYGAAEVRVCGVPSTRPGPAGVVGHRQVCDFVLDTATWRLGVLSRLLEELALPRGERGPVVLGVDSPDHGALWVGAVSHLMSPRSAVRMGFGVWETPRALQPSRGSRLELICMPMAEIVAVRERFPGLVVMTESDDAAPREWSPTDSAGHLAWSALALGMFSLAQDPVAVLEDIDALSARVGDRDLARYWPLALAMGRRIHSWDFLSHPIAAALRAATPPEVGQEADLLDTIVELVGRHTGTTASAAWDALCACGPGPIRAVHQTIYLSRALAEDAWLSQAGGVPAAKDQGWHLQAHPGMDDEVAAAVNRIASNDDPVTRAIAMVNLSDLLVRSGWPMTDPDALGHGRLLGAVARAVRPVLASPQERAPIVGMTHVAPETLQAILRPALADWPEQVAGELRRPVGRRIPPAALGWLYPTDPTDPVTGGLPADLSLLDVEVLALAATSGSDGSARDRARSRLLAEVDALDDPSASDIRHQLLAVVYESRHLCASEVAHLAARGCRVPDTQVAAALLGAQADEYEDVANLLVHLTERRDRPAIDTFVPLLSVLDRLPAWGAPTFEVAVDKYAPKLLRDFTSLWAFARIPTGSMWAGHLAAAVELTDAVADPRGVLEALFPASGSVVPGCAELFESLLKLPSSSGMNVQRLPKIALRSMICEADFPRPAHATSLPMLAHSMVDVNGSAALTSALSSYYSTLSRDELLAARDGLFSLVASIYGEGSEAVTFARTWFGRVGGSRGVGERIRGVGRLFGR
jgi:hypothetical protein